MSGHVVNPPLHAWLGRRRQVKYDVLRLHQWDFLQGEGNQNRTKSKVLQLPVLYLGQLTFHLKKYCITLVEYFRLETLQGVLHIRSVSDMKRCTTGHPTNSIQNGPERPVSNLTDNNLAISARLRTFPAILANIISGGIGPPGRT